MKGCFYCLLVSVKIKDKRGEERKKKDCMHQNEYSFITHIALEHKGSRDESNVALEAITSQKFH